MSAESEALSGALAALQALEQELAASATALDARRARAKEAEQQVGELTRALSAADPDGRDFAKLSGQRQTAKDRAEALRAQHAKAEGEHKGLAARVEKARAAHQKAIRDEAEARIRQSSGELTAALEKFVRQFRPQIEAHYQLLVEENKARGTSNPFGIWGTAYPDPGLEVFWGMVYKAHLETLRPGTPEYASARQAMEVQGAMVASIMNGGGAR